MLNQQLLKLLETLIARLKTLIVSNNRQTAQGLKLYETAKTFIGQDASPRDIASDDLSCSESVNAVCEKAWGEPVGGDVSTYRMYYVLLNHRKFAEVKSPLAGDLVISPTGVGGGRNGIKNGHVGIMSSNGRIMSSDSATGLWQENYDLWSWRYRFVVNGGYLMKYYRRIF